MKDDLVNPNSDAISGDELSLSPSSSDGGLLVSIWGIVGNIDGESDIRYLNLRAL